MQHISKLSVGQKVTFPEWCGESHYMLPFTISSGLPSSVFRFQKSVDQMMEGVSVDRNQTCYLMVDEKEIVPNSFHRRSGLHVDGYWHPGSGHGNHVASCHGGHPPIPHHDDRPPNPSPGHGSRHCYGNSVREGLLLASNYSAARALTGTYIRDFEVDWAGGDCSSIKTGGLQEVILQSGLAYHMDVMTLHESLLINEHVRRTVVRINVPNWRN